MAEKLRWGVLSTSNIGRVAVNPAIQASSNGELLAVASRDPERARQFAREQGIPRAYGSYLSLLEDDDIQALYVPLPNSLHHEWTIRAAQHGKHVLCEKPLALNEQECREMESTARENGVKLMEAFMYRFHPRTGRVLELLREGTIGQAKVIRSSFSFRLTNSKNIRLSRELGGGALMDVGCYCVNVSRTLAGLEPSEVQAWARIGKSGVDEELVGTLRFPGDLLAQFDCALTLERREGYEVAGPEGSLLVPGAFLPGSAETLILQRRGRQAELQHRVAGTDQYRHMVEHFADCVLNDTLPQYSAREAGLNMRVIRALYESSEQGGAVVRVEQAT